MITESYQYEVIQRMLIVCLANGWVIYVFQITITIAT